MTFNELRRFEEVFAFLFYPLIITFSEQKWSVNKNMHLESSKDGKCENVVKLQLPSSNQLF